MTKVIKEKFNNVILVRLFLIAIVLISVLYVYFLNNTIQAIVQTKNSTKNIQIISQEYQNLEGKYFNLLGKIDIDYASQMGFIDQSQKIDYIVRQTAVAYGRGFFLFFYLPLF
ncbi:MAG: hypothetical protein NTX55_01845 [Candidatus Parcubacteria bacterium]|nr:hypothetical protein [Candidatus Parcubacteria bacterium]